jgi:hypothetical protein
MVILSPLDVDSESISLAKRSPSLNFVGRGNIVFFFLSKFKIVEVLTVAVLH